MHAGWKELILSKTEPSSTEELQSDVVGAEQNNGQVDRIGDWIFVELVLERFEACAAYESSALRPHFFLHVASLFQRLFCFLQNTTLVRVQPRCKNNSELSLRLQSIIENHHTYRGTARLTCPISSAYEDGLRARVWGLPLGNGSGR